MSQLLNLVVLSRNKSYPMPNYLHHEFDLSANDTVEMTLDNRANVRLLDDANLLLYKSGKHRRYHGGFAKTSPIRIAAPRAGHWHVRHYLGGAQHSAAARTADHPALAPELAHGFGRGFQPALFSRALAMEYRRARQLFVAIDHFSDGTVGTS